MAANEIKAGKAVVEVSLRDRIGKGLQSIERKLANTGRNIASLGGAVTAGFGGVLAALAWPTKLAADMEVTRAGFLTLTKSVETTDKLLEQIKSAAASTPFEFPELAEAARSLIAFGSSADGVVAEMMTIGDVAAGIHAPIGEIAELYGKARVNGRLFADDINQLTGRGIPIIQELAKQFGVTDNEVKKLVENGSVNFGNLEAAFQNMTTGAGIFAGGMKAASLTVIGKWSSMKDAIAETVRPIGEALIPIVGALIERLGGLLTPIGAWIKANQGLVPAIAAVAAGGVVFGSVLTALGVGLVGLSSIVGVFGTVWTAVFAPIYAAVAGIGLTAAAIIALGAAAGSAAIYIFARMGLVSDAFENLKIVFFGLLTTARQTFGGITDALAAGQYVLAARTLWAGMKVAFLQGGAAVLQSIGYVWNHATEITTKFFFKLIESAYRVFKSMPRVIMSALKGGASLGELLFDAMSGGGGVGGMLDGPLATAQAELNALNKQAANFNRNMQGRGNNQQQQPAMMRPQQNPARQPQFRGQQLPQQQLAEPEFRGQKLPQQQFAGQQRQMQLAEAQAQQQLQQAMAEAQRQQQMAGRQQPGIRQQPIPDLARRAGENALRVDNQAGGQIAGNALLIGGALEKLTEQIVTNTYRASQQLGFLNDKIGAGARV